LEEASKTVVAAMKTHCSLWFGVILLLSGSSLAALSEEGPFVLDNSRPWIDIAFRRVGERVPVFPTESKHGLWLALRNNCRYPIGVTTMEWSDQPNKNEGTLLVYDVVPYVPSISTTPLPPGAPAAKILANATLEKPSGYALPGDFAISAEVKPGKELLFSVPLESVTRKWSIRIRIDFRIPGDRGVQPLVFVDFEFWQLPKDVQSLSDQMLDGALP
jgi:hypothetical protein